MRFLSLFSGIGGIDLGLERAGMTCIGQVEIDSYCRQVLAKHWPGIPRHDDVKTFRGDEFGQFDLLTGGYPCQPFSQAGRRQGKNDPRHLWPEVLRIIRTVRPRFVLLENVPGHLSLGFGQVLGDLSESGYDAEWDCIPASACGAHHQRDRVFIMADSHSSGREEFYFATESARTRLRTWRSTQKRGIWSSESDVGRVAHGIPRRMDRLRGLGNAVVPQVAEYIGRQIMAAEAVAS